MKQFFIFCLLLQAASFAQEKELLYVYNGKAASLFLSIAPESGDTIRLFRSEAGGGFVDITGGSPLVAAEQPADVYAALGNRMEQVKKYLDAENDYDVYLAIQGNSARGAIVSLLFPEAAIASGRLFIDSSVTPGKTYTYKAVYYNYTGEAGSVTKTVSAVKPQLKEPLKLTGEVTAGMVLLRWEYPSWSGDKDNLAVSYRVFKKLQDGTARRLNDRPILRNDAEAPEFSFAVTTQEAEGEFFITAVDFAGNESKPSASVKLKLNTSPVPEPPNGITASPADFGVNVLWNISVQKGLKGYNLYRKEAGGKDTTQVNKAMLPLNQPFFFDSMVVSGRQYFYYVRTVAADGKLSRLSEMAAALYEDKIPPVAPENLRLTVVKQLIKLEWNKSASRDVKGYRVYRGYQKDAMSMLDLYASGTSFTDSGYSSNGFEAGSTCYYSVSAVDFSDNQSKQTPVAVVVYPDKEPPGLPGNFYAELKERAVVKLTIGRSPARDLAKITVFRKLLDGKAKPELFAKLPSLPASFTDTTCRLGQRYVYQLQLTDTAGNVSPVLASDTVLVTNTLQPPVVPALAAKVVKNGVEVTWLGVVQYDLAGYNIYKCTIPNGVFELVNKAPVKGSRYTDKEGKPDIFYRVRAVTTSGVEGGWSKVVGVNPEGEGTPPDDGTDNQEGE